jgi:hypothetical protein
MSRGNHQSHVHSWQKILQHLIRSGLQFISSFLSSTSMKDVENHLSLPVLNNKNCLERSPSSFIALLPLLLLSSHTNKIQPKNFRNHHSKTVPIPSFLFFSHTSHITSSSKHDPLSQGDSSAKIDSGSPPTHVLLPCVTPTLPTPSGLLIPSERSTDLGPAA